MKKKIIVLTAFLTALASFTACGSTSSSSSEKAATTSAATSEASSDASTEASTEEKTTAATTTKAPETTEKPAEADAPNIDIADLAGNWIYELQDAGAGPEFVGTPKGSVVISANGTYTYNNGSYTENGTLKARYEEFADGSKVPFLAFNKESGEMWIGCYINDMADTSKYLYIGNGGTERLVRDNGAEPNFYGFYEYTEPMREGAAFNSVKSLEGEWLHGQFVLTFSECDTYMGGFHDENEDGEFVGTVRLEYSNNADGTQQLWYNLYTNDGGLYKSFKVTQDIPLDSITDETQYGIEHTRIIRDE
ncbi:MAG: hypothetical protein IKO47_07620 [Ruminococcus sp.]|nr:hypothetical protein [Ruminococcus sp.]